LAAAVPAWPRDTFQVVPDTKLVKYRISLSIRTSSPATNAYSVVSTNGLTGVLDANVIVSEPAVIAPLSVVTYGPAPAPLESTKSWDSQLARLEFRFGCDV